MKFAYLILGEFVYPQDSAAIHGETAQIIGVSNLEEACAAAKKLAANGVGCIELLRCVWRKRSQKNHRGHRTQNPHRICYPFTRAKKKHLKWHSAESDFNNWSNQTLEVKQCKNFEAGLSSILGKRISSCFFCVCAHPPLGCCSYTAQQKMARPS